MAGVGKMSPKESLDQLGTIAFSMEQMNKLIGFGDPIIERGMFRGFDFEANPNKLSCEVWIEFVPEKFKQIAIDMVNAVAPQFDRIKVTEDTRMTFIYKLQALAMKGIMEGTLMR